MISSPMVRKLHLYVVAGMAISGFWAVPAWAAGSMTTGGGHDIVLPAPARVFVILLVEHGFMPLSELIRRQFPDRTGRESSGLGIRTEELKVLEDDPDLARVDVVFDQLSGNVLSSACRQNGH